MHNTQGAGVWYTNGNTTNQSVKNADMTLSLGMVRSALFAGYTFKPRVWNGTIHYYKRTTASYGIFGSGCKGSNGVPTLAPKLGSLPKVPSTFVLELANLPTKPGVGIMLTAFSNDTFLGKELLPLDLTPLGAPGCRLLIDSFLVGAFTISGGKGSFTFPIPNVPILIGFAVYNQAFIPDPTVNSAGIVMSNGGDGRFGT